MIRKLIALAALLLAAAGASASCPPVRKVIVPAVVSPIIIPTYSASYTASQDGTLRDILAELRAIRQELRSSKGEAVSFQARGAGKCANCHQERNAGAAGGGFVLLENDGRLPPMSLPEKRRIVDLVSKGAMPPPKSGVALTDAEKTITKEYLSKKD